MKKLIGILGLIAVIFSAPVYAKDYDSSVVMQYDGRLSMTVTTNSTTPDGTKLHIAVYDSDGRLESLLPHSLEQTAGETKVYAIIASGPMEGGKTVKAMIWNGVKPLSNPDSLVTKNTSSGGLVIPDYDVPEYKYPTDSDDIPTFDDLKNDNVIDFIIVPDRIISYPVYNPSDDIGDITILGPSDVDYDIGFGNRFDNIIGDIILSPYIP